MSVHKFKVGDLVWYNKTPGLVIALSDPMCLYPIHLLFWRKGKMGFEFVSPEHLSPNGTGAVVKMIEWRK